MWGLQTLREPAILRGRGCKRTGEVYVLQPFRSSKRGPVSTPRRSHAPPIMRPKYLLPCVNRRDIFAPLSGLTTECDLRPASSTCSPERLSYIAESAARACLFVPDSKARPHGVPAECSWQHRPRHRPCRRGSQMEICENFHADMRIATAKSAILSSHQLSPADGQTHRV